MAGTASGEPPAIGALVRVIVPELGPDWQLGMFNRLRVEPPCYRVLVFQLDGVSSPDILPLDQIERLQVHNIYDGRDRQAPSSAAVQKWNETDWQEVPIKPLQEMNLRQCPAMLSSR